MTNEENKRIVEEGLERRKTDRLEAEKEAQLEQYEQDMIDTCNENCADAKLLRQEKEKDRLIREQEEARRKARQEARAKEAARDDAAIHACRYYGLACLFILWLVSVTRFPIWAAAALILGLAVFPAAYIFRLYFPIKR